MNKHDSNLNKQPTQVHNLQQILKITWIGMGINFLLAGLKFIVGIIGSSQAIIADAVHSLSDMSTDLAILFGAKYWSAPADENHPFGHLRIETLITAFIGILLIASGLGIGYHAIANLQKNSLNQPGWIALSGAVVSIIVKELLYRWTILVGKRVKSSAVVANAWHHRTDAFSSLPAAIAVTLAALRPELAFVDAVGALIVMVFILKVGWDITSTALVSLTDVSASKKDRAQIYALAMAVEGVEQVHAIRTRHLGSRLHVDLHIEVDGELTVREGHDISELVKQALLEKGPEVVDVVVHLEPVDD